MQQRSTSCLNKWNTIEQLYLVSAIRQLGDNNWATICNRLKGAFNERPANWITPETCEAQYKWLHENHVKLEISCERPTDQILDYLKTVAKKEGQQKEDQERKYIECKKRIELFSKNENDLKIVEEFYEDALRWKKEVEENTRKYQEGLRRRDVPRTESDNIGVSKSPSKSDNKTEGSSTASTSPLLSSLLANPVVANPLRTLSTSSFISNKSIPGSHRVTSPDRVPTLSTDISFKDTFSPDLSDQSPSINDRASGLFGKTMSAARVLDFQDASCSSSIISNPRSSTVIEVIKGSVVENEAIVKPDPQNLENLALIAPSVEDADMSDLMHVIDHLRDHEVLGKVISQLTNTGEDVIINQDLSTASIPVDGSFVASSEANESVPSLSTEASQSAIVDSTIKTELEEPVSQYDETHSVIVIEEEPVNDRVEESSPSIVVSEPSPIVETITLNPDSSSFSSLVAVSVGSESTSEVKSDSEPLIEYLDASAVDEDNKINVYSQSSANHKPIEQVDNAFEDVKPTNFVKNDQIGSSNYEVNDMEPNEGANTSDATRESAEGYETCESLPDVSDPCQPAENMIVESEPNVPEVAPAPEVKTEAMAVAEKEPVDEYTFVEETNEVSTGLENDSKEVESVAEDVRVEEQEQQEVKTEVKVEAEPEKMENTVEEVDETKTKSEMIVEEMSESEEEKPADAAVETTPETKPDIGELNAIPEPVDTKRTEFVAIEVPAEDTQSNDTKVLPPSAVEEVKTSESEATVKSSAAPVAVLSPLKDVGVEKEEKSAQGAKHALRLSRKRRNTTSESSESKVPKTLPDVAEHVEDETPSNEVARAKELNISITDLREELDPQLAEALLKLKEEPVEEDTAPLSVTPTKSKPEKTKEDKTSSEGKDSKNRSRVPRKSSLRNQNQILKADGTPPSSRSRTPENAQQAAMKRSLALAHQRLTQLKYSNTFMRPITNKQAAGYEDVIYCPMDLQTMKRKIDNKQISTVTEFQRDVLLMINNAKMFNRMHSQVYNMAVEVQREALHDIEVTVQTLGEGILLSMTENSEKIRKRQSLDGSRNDHKVATKRTKPPAKDDGAPIKKIKLEENDVDTQS